MTIIAVAHQKGGVGKTTVIVNVAAEVNPDVLIDLDAHRSLVIINSLRGEGNLMPVVTCESKGDLIKHLKKSGEGKTVLIDCGGFDSELNRLAIAAADLVIVPANDDTTELIGLRHFNTVLGDVSREMNAHITGRVLFNRVHPSRTKFDSIESFLDNAKHLQRLDSVIPRLQAYPDAIGHGLGVTECKKTKYGTAASKMKKLVEEIKGLVSA